MSCADASAAWRRCLAEPCCAFFFFFFKQKTAYEIDCDWSSDVCSSDLRVLAADNDPRTVVADEHARYFGTELTDTSITAGPDARLGKTSFAEWLAHNHK